MNELPNNPSESVYIDRAEFRDKILTLIKSGTPKNIVMGDTKATYGSGKTTNLAKIFYDLKEDKDCTPVWLSLSCYSIYHTNEKIQDYGSIEALKQNLDDYKRLLIDLGNWIDSDAFEVLPRRIVEIADNQFEKLFKFDISAKGGDAKLGALTKVAEAELKGGDVSIDIKIQDQEKILRFVVDAKRQKINVEFMELFKPIAKRKKFIIIADDFCWIIDHSIGSWLLQLLSMMDNTFTLISRTQTDSALMWQTNRLQTLHLQPFTLDETQEYLMERCLDPNHAQLEKIYLFSQNGHPLLVSIAADLLCHLERRRAHDMDCVLNRLIGEKNIHQGDNIGGSGSELINVEAITTSLDRIIMELRRDIREYDPVLMPGLDILTIARLVDRELIEYIFTEYLREEHADQPIVDTFLEERACKLANDLVRRMQYYSVIQQIKQGDKDCFQLQTLVRERMEVILSKTRSPSYIERLHNLLAAYFGGKESQYLQSHGEYSRMFRLENSAWQSDMIEWLYHLFRMKTRDKALLQLTRIYLEAFDWWGWYIAFEFCNELLTVWNQTQPAEDTEFLSYLLDFQQAYPLGYDKDGKGCWAELHKAIQNIKQKLKLDISLENMNADQRMVRGHIDRFIADSHRYHVQKDEKKQDAAYRRAELFYQSSLEYFEPAWNRMWIIHYLADLQLDWAKLARVMGDEDLAGKKFAQAKKLAFESIQMAMEEDDFFEKDHELISQNYRVLGDMVLLLGQPSKSMMAYTRALVYAYIFHFLEDNRDNYSYKFYYDTGEHILESIIQIVQSEGLEIAHRACEYLRCFWEENAGFDYAHEILMEIPPDFDIDWALSSHKGNLLRSYILPHLPDVGEEGNPIDVGVAVSHYLAEIVKDDDFIPKTNE
jgi:hypothetical protein